MSKKKLDANQFARSIVDAINTDEPKPSDLSKAQRSELAKLLGRAGGLKGGKARKEALSEERRKEIAQKAAAARWKKK